MSWLGVGGVAVDDDASEVPILGHVALLNGSLILHSSVGRGVLLTPTWQIVRATA